MRYMALVLGESMDRVPLKNRDALRTLTLRVVYLVRYRD